MSAGSLSVDPPSVSSPNDVSVGAALVPVRPECVTLRWLEGGVPNGSYVTMVMGGTSISIRKLGKVLARHLDKPFVDLAVVFRPLVLRSNENE